MTSGLAEFFESLASLSDGEVFNTAPPQFPDVRFGTTNLAKTELFIENSQSLFKNPVADSALICKCSYIRFIENVQVLEEPHQFAILTDMSQYIHTKGSNCSPVVRIVLNLFLDTLNMLITDKLSWINNLGPLDVFWNTASVFFAEDPLEQCEFFCLHLINLFMYQASATNSTWMEYLIGKISESMTEHKNYAYNFYVFLLQLMTSPIDGVWEIMNQKRLFGPFGAVAEYDDNFFVLFMFFVYAHTKIVLEYALSQQVLCSLIIQGFFTPQRREYIMSVISWAYENICQKEPHFHALAVLFVPMFTVLMEKSTAEKNPDGVLMVSVFARVSANLTNDLVKKFVFEHRVLDAIAAYAVAVPDRFDWILNMLTIAFKTNSMLLDVVNESDQTFFERLEKVNVDNVNSVLPRLKDFVCCGNGKNKIEKTTIGNRKGLHLTMSFCQNDPTCEEDLLKWMIALAGDSTNIYELHRANVPFVIINRVKEVQDNRDLRRLYLKLYELLCCKIFTNRIFKQTIEMIRGKNYFYPGEFVAVFHKIMRYVDEEDPRAFFWWSEMGNVGIQTPEIRFPSVFSIAFSFQAFDTIVKYQSRPVITPIASIRVRTDEIIEGQLIGDQQSIIFRVVKGSTTVAEISFDAVSATDGIWHNVIIVIGEKKEITLKIDDLQKSVKGFVRWDGMGSVSIGDPSGSQCMSSLPFKVSAVYCMTATDIGEIESVFKRGDRQLTSDLRAKVICQLSPLLVQGNNLFGFSRECPKISFSGKIVSSINSGKELLCRISSLKNIFPLFTRLSLRCSECNETDACHNCGALSALSGSCLIEALITLMSDIMDADERLFVVYDFFTFISEMFARIDNKYIADLSMISTISEIFTGVKSPVLKKDFAEQVLWNFSIFEKWPPSAFVCYVSSVLKCGLSYDPDAFKYPIAPNLPIIFEKITDLTSIGVIDNFVSAFFSIHQFQEDLDTLLLIACNSTDPSCRSRCIRMIEVILENKPSFIVPHEYVEYFLLFLGEPCQTEALNCIRFVVDYPESQIDCVQLAYRIALLWKPELIPTESIAKTMEVLDGLCFVDVNSSPKWRSNGAFLPVMATFCHRENITMNERGWIASVLIPRLMHNPKEFVSFFANPYWMHWIFLIFDVARNYSSADLQTPSILEFVEVTAAPLPLASRTEILSDLLCYNEIFRGHTGVDLVECDKHLDSEIITEGIGDIKALQMILLDILCDSSYVKTDEPLVVSPEANRASIPFGLFTNRVSVSRTIKEKIDAPRDGVMHIIHCLMTFSKELEIGGIIEDSRVLCAYLISKTLTDDSNIFTVEVEALSSLCEQAEPRVRARSAQILVNTMTALQMETSVKASLENILKTDWRSQFVPFSPQIFATPEVAKDNEAWYEGLQMSMLRKLEDHMKLDSFDQTKLVSKACADSLLEDAKDGFLQKRTVIARRDVIRAKALECLLRELRCGAGPWSEATDTQDKKFKAWTRISTKGKRVLMRLNHHFVTHADASAKRDSADASKIPSEMVLKYSPVKKQASMAGSEGMLFAEAQRICVGTQETGLVYVKDTEMGFTSNEKAITIPFTCIRFILNRRIRHREVGIEVYLRTGVSYMFALSENSRKDLYSTLAKLRLARTERHLPGKFNFFAKLQEICGNLHQTVPSKKLLEATGITEKWRRWELTTYEYLYYLNILSGRSFCDLAQYPIYPWVLLNQEYDTIELDNPLYFRDLSKSLLALSPDVLEARKTEYDPSFELTNWLSQAIISSRLDVVWRMIRVEPFTTEHIILQSGVFDNPCRLFHAISEGWERVHENIGLRTELIPDYFTFPYLFVNENHFDLGVRETNERVDDVVLPPWASSHFHFVSVQRRALESELASEKISRWIDYVFGVYRASVELGNLFPPWAYPENNMYDNIMTEECGSLPQSLFSSEHPQRDKNPMEKYIWNQDTYDKVAAALMEHDSLSICACLKGVVFCENRIFNIQTCEWKDVPLDAYGRPWAVSASLNLAAFGLKNSNVLSLVNLCNGKVTQHEQLNSLITCACICGGEYLVTGSHDSSVHVYRLPDLTVESISAHQSDSIIAVAANAEIGLVVSVSAKDMMVIETLLDGRFINAVKIPTTTGDVQLLVFKSGTIVLVTLGSISFFDARGMHIRSLAIEKECLGKVSIDSYYDYDQREFLLATVAGQRIGLIDVSAQTVIAIHETKVIHPSVYAIKRSRSCLVLGRNTGEVEWFCFASDLTQKVSKLPSHLM